MEFSCLLWYLNHEHMVFFRLKGHKTWHEWQPENKCDDTKFEYKIVDIKTWTEKTCT